MFQLQSTTKNLESQYKKSKQRKYDANYYQSRCEELEKCNGSLNSKLVGLACLLCPIICDVTGNHVCYEFSQSDSLAMLRASERTCNDLRAHISDLTSRLKEFETQELNSDSTYNEFKTSLDTHNRSLQASGDTAVMQSAVVQISHTATYFRVERK